MDKDVKRINSVISDMQPRVNSSVQYTPQNLTYSEKAQVRSNIGAVSKYEELDDRPCYLKKSYVSSISSTSLNALNGTNIFIALYSQSSYGMIKENKKYISKWGHAITDEIALQSKYATLHLANGTATSILYVGNPALLKTAAFYLHSIFGLSAKVTSVSADDIDFEFSYCWSTMIQSDGTYKNMVLSRIKNGATLYQVDELRLLSDALLPDTIPRTYNVGTVPKIRSINDNGKILQAKGMTWVMAPFPTIPKDYFASTDALPQHAMSANPTEDMHIATKKYVDDNTPTQTVQKIESTDQSNMVSIRSIDSGTYILYGYFKPYVGADSTMTFSSNLLVNILKGDTESHVQVFHPYNNCVQYLKITDSSYERKDTYLGNLMTKSDDVIINSSTEGSAKKFKITVDDAGAITATEVTE